MGLQQQCRPGLLTQGCLVWEGHAKKEATATQTGGPACQPDLSGPAFLSQKQVAQPTPCGVLTDPKGNVYQVPSNKRHPKLTLGAQEGSSKPPLIPGEGLAQQGREVLCAHTTLPCPFTRVLFCPC